MADDAHRRTAALCHWLALKGGGEEAKIIEVRELPLPVRRRDLSVRDQKQSEIKITVSPANLLLVRERNRSFPCGTKTESIAGSPTNLLQGSAPAATWHVRARLAHTNEARREDCRRAAKCRRV